MSGQHFFKDHQFNLALNHVTSKSMGIIFSLESSTIPSSATFKQRSQKILSGRRFVYRQTDRSRKTQRPTDRRTIWPFLQGGHKNWKKLFKNWYVIPKFQSINNIKKMSFKEKKAIKKHKHGQAVYQTCDKGNPVLRPSPRTRVNRRSCNI